MALYPNYRPAGIRKSWDHCSMDVEGSAKVLQSRGCPKGWGNPAEAVAWFDDLGALRVLVADFSNGRRVELRKRARDTQISYSPAVSAA